MVGEPSVGNVNAAASFPIRDGALFVTTATTLVGPNKRVIAKGGVTPDKKVDLDLDLLRREGRDSQLEAATDYLKQKLGR